MDLDIELINTYFKEKRNSRLKCIVSSCIAVVSFLAIVWIIGDVINDVDDVNNDKLWVDIGSISLAGILLLLASLVFCQGYSRASMSVEESLEGILDRTTSYALTSGGERKGLAIFIDCFEHIDYIKNRTASICYYDTKHHLDDMKSLVENIEFAQKELNRKSFSKFVDFLKLNEFVKEQEAKYAKSSMDVELTYVEELEKLRRIILPIQGGVSYEDKHFDYGVMLI